MGAAGIEIPMTMTDAQSEHLYRRARILCQQRREGAFQQGIRAARSRDERLLKVLDVWTERISQTAESQLGRTRREGDVQDNIALRLEPTEVQLVRTAYQLVDKGRTEAGVEITPTILAPDGWILAAAGEAAGVVIS